MRGASERERCPECGASGDETKFLMCKETCEEVDTEVRPKKKVVFCGLGAFIIWIARCIFALVMINSANCSSVGHMSDG